MPEIKVVDISIAQTQEMEANYPQRTGKIFVINGIKLVISIKFIKYYFLNIYIIAPKLFSIAFAIVRPFFHKRSANNFKIYGHDSEEWKKELLEYIDADQLPACYGGTMTDPDGNPNCVTKVLVLYSLL